MTTLYETGHVKLVQVAPNGLAFYVGERLVWSSHKLRNGRAFPLDEAKRLYLDERMSMRQIADRFGYTFAGIVYQLKKAGVKFRSRGGPRKRA